MYLKYSLISEKADVTNEYVRLNYYSSTKLYEINVMKIKLTMKHNGGEEYITRSFMLCTLHHISFKKTEMGRTCGTYGGEERCIQDFSGETLGKETTWKTQA
jgi:hypothetical protein